MNSKETNINLIKKLHYIWNTGDLDLIPDVYSDNFVVHWPKGWGEKAFGYEGIKTSIMETRRIFTNWNEEILDIIVGEDKVVTRYRSTGLHSAEYLSFSPTGKKIEFEEISIYRIDKNKVVEQWCLGDDFHLQNQLKED